MPTIFRNPRGPKVPGAATRYGAVALTTASLLLPALLAAAPAQAADHTDDKGKPPTKPPGQMSTVGGDALGRPGRQVQPESGAPALPKDLSGRSWLVADAESGEILAAENAHWRLPPASTLKMLFADTVLPKFPKTQTHKVAPEELQGMGAGSSLVGIKENLTYTVHDLWRGVFLKSGNDAVHVLAAMNGGIPKTVADMQAHAKKLRADDTHVVSPDGYDEPGQVSSAYDLTLFARSGLQNADFREYCSTQSAQFPGEEKKDKKGKQGKKRESFGIQNTNRLLVGDQYNGVQPYKGIAGVKNGNTTNAGATFTGVAQRGERKLLVTVMNPQKAEADEVYKESARLLDWGFAAAEHVKPVGMLVPPQGVGDKSGGKSGVKNQSGAQASVAGSGGGGMGTALGIAGGAVVVLAAAAFLVNRRWPLRRRRS